MAPCPTRHGNEPIAHVDEGHAGAQHVALGHVEANDIPGYRTRGRPRGDQGDGLPAQGGRLRGGGGGSRTARKKRPALLNARVHVDTLVQSARKAAVSFADAAYKAASTKLVNQRLGNRAEIIVQQAEDEAAFKGNGITHANSAKFVVDAPSGHLYMSGVTAIQDGEIMLSSHPKALQKHLNQPIADVAKRLSVSYSSSNNN